MNKSDSITKLAPALVKAQADIKAAQKSGDNKFDRYTYSKLEDFLDSAKPALAKHGLAIVISNPIVSALADRSTQKGGTEHVCQVQVVITILHESGEWIEVVGHGEGQDRADKSIYKAITGAKKYAIAGLLAIPTTDDPEADESVGQKEAPRPKLDSNGVVHTKMPEWSAEQKKESGEYTTAIMAMLEKIYPPNKPENISKPLTTLKLWKDERKYDAPTDVIDAFAAWKRQLQDIILEAEGNA